MRISVGMKRIIIHKINAATPRLSDEELDPLEQDDGEGVPSEMIDGYLIWTTDDISDVRNLIEFYLAEQERKILSAFIEGLTYQDMGVTEKYWRYHFAKGIEIIRKELGIDRK